MSLFSSHRHTGYHAGDDLQNGPAPVRLDGVRKGAMETGRSRLAITSAVFMVIFGLIGLRMVDVAVLDRNPASPRPVPQARTEPLEMERADITDRNGVILATSLPTVSLYAKATEILDPVEAAEKLVTVLPDLSRDDLVEKLGSSRTFVYLRRNLTPRQHYDVNALGIPGVYFERGERRVYPHGSLAAHIVGMTDIDSKGIAGIEKRFDGILRGEKQPIRLALDVRMQTVMRNELTAAMQKFSAVGAVGVVMDVKSGELVSAVSLPDFDPHEPPAGAHPNLFNRVTSGVYEPGSTFKLFNTALALDTGIATPTTGFDARGSFKYGRHTINDYHGEDRWLTVGEVLMYSSNIGSARMALAAGTPAQRALMGKLGFLSTPQVELPEVGGPLVPNPWREINTITISYGHGLSVSPLQLVAGTAALVNGGEYRSPTLLAGNGESPPGERVIKEKTSEQMRRLMRQTVTEGTGKKADVPGYEVGGKTGTAEKPVDGSYKRKAVLSSFIGAFPMDDPRFVVLVMIDEPKGIKETHNFITGGWTAAPSVARIIAQIAPLAGLQPKAIPTPSPPGKSPIVGQGSKEVAAVE